MNVTKNLMKPKASCEW